MLRKIVQGIAFALLAPMLARAQQPQCAYQVNFTDKNNTPYSLSSPSAYLSARALARRTAQGIAVDSTDIPVNHSYIDSILTLTGGVFHESSRWKNLMVVLVNEADTAGVLQSLNSLTFVSSAQIVGYYGGTGLHGKQQVVHDSVLPAVPYAGRTTSDAAYYGFTWAQTQLVNGNVLHDEGHLAQGKMIAILDAGFVGADTCPYGFDSLRTSGRIIDVHNFSYGSDFVYGYDNHGTAVLSTMAGYVPDTFVGSAPRAMYDLYVTETEPTEQPLELVNLLCGTERADSVGADVITCSLGYNTFDNPIYDFDVTTQFDGKTTLAAQAVNTATQKGILFVSSAGNEGAKTAPWNMILTPGDADSALTVGNVKPDGTIAATSGYGPNNAGNIKPDVCAQGQSANVVDGTQYIADNGTSFSTPQIAGWAACLWQAHPEATPSSLRRAIDSCASIHWAPNSHYGYGIANFSCSDFLLSVKSPVLPVNQLSVSPNPFTDEIKLQVNLSVSGTLNIRIVDIWGRVVRSESVAAIAGYTAQTTINTTGLAAGVYLLQAHSEKMNQVLRIVKP